jgi:hypothetical protein
MMPEGMKKETEIMPGISKRKGLGAQDICRAYKKRSKK